MQRTRQENGELEAVPHQTGTSLCVVTTLLVFIFLPAPDLGALTLQQDREPSEGGTSSPVIRNFAEGTWRKLLFSLHH